MNGKTKAELAVIASRRQEAARLFAQGKTKPEIAKLMNVSRKTVQSWLPPARLSRDTQLIARIRQLAASGMPATVIAKTLGVSYSSVTGVIGPTRHAPRTAPPTKKYAVHLTEADHDAAITLALKLGATPAWGYGAGEGSLSLLIERIVSGELLIAKRPPLSKT